MTRPEKDRLALAIVLVVFVISRLLYSSDALAIATPSFQGNVIARAAAALRGEHMDVETLHQGMPLLEESLLREDLWRSLLYLHSQPPLFNLLVAGMLRLPGDFALNYQILNWAVGLSIYILAFRLMSVLGAERAPAVLMTVLFMLNPNSMWMEGAVYYGVVMAALMGAAAFSFWRALESGSARAFALCLLFLTLIPLTRAFFSVPWFLVMVGFVGWAFRSHVVARQPRRGALTAFIVPLALGVVIVVGFQMKQGILFGQWLGSSWFGCNLATMTAGMSAEKESALRRGDVSPLVNVYRNDAVPAYRPFFDVPVTGIPALDREWKTTGEPNFNHLIYIPVGRQYLSDTVHLIVRNPLKYLLNVVNSVYILSGYQIGVYFDYPSRFFARWAWWEIAAPFIGFPLIVIAIVTGVRRLRRTERPQRLLLSFMLLNIAYVIAVAVLVEKSEGPLYRYQVDAFLFALLALAATDLRRRLRRSEPEPR
ncbi:MAG: hypothetical protein ACRD2J_16140 [Thermoanaerobaculia bacterium]